MSHNDKRNKFVFGGMSLCTSIFAVLGALAGEALFLTYGIMALLPTGPFEERNETLGIVLIVLAGVGAAAFGGTIAGVIAGIMLGGSTGMLLDYCCSNCENNSSLTA